MLKQEVEKLEVSIRGEIQKGRRFGVEEKRGQVVAGRHAVVA